MRGRSDSRRFRRHLADERQGAAVYRAMAGRTDGQTRDILLGLAEAEERHAEHWVSALEALGEEVDNPGGRQRGGLLGFLARRVGVAAVVPLLERREAAELDRYESEPMATEAMAVDERVHSRVIANLFPGWRTRTSGSLRAATFGVNDGLVSNLSLVMGVAGGQATDQTILLAGLAGLIGGGLSMGIGEWISVTSQRELWEGEVRLDEAQLGHLPDGGANELSLLLRTKGMDAAEAEASARVLLEDPATASRLLASEKLGFDADALGSPWAAAGSNLGAFVVGAAVPVAPFLFADGIAALVLAVVLSALSLFGVGSLISLLTYRSALRSGARQLAIGVLAAAVTYGVGTLIGGSLG